MREADNIREIERVIANSPLFFASSDASRSTLHSSLFLMGFIFWPKSSRYVSERPAYLPTICKRVGVFVDEDIENVRRIANDYALDYIQLHGHESPDYIRALRMTDGFPINIRLIKAISVSGSDDVATHKQYEGLVDYFLFDTKCPTVGGSGQQFDWSVLSAYNGNTPFLLSGGIGPDDAELLTSPLGSAALHSKDLSPLISKHCIGIDLNSRFELAPGIKDINKLRTFLNAINNGK